MKWIQVAAAALNQTPLDWRGNAGRCREAITQARDQGSSVLCLPELCLSGYGCEDAFHATHVQKTAWQCLLDLVSETKGMIVSFGLPILYQNGLFNTACLVADGEICGFVAKRFLAGDGIHYEPRWFKPWPQGVCATITRDGMEYPIGDLVFECGGIRFGFEICEDAWVATRPGATLSLLGVDVILNPSASHFAFGKMTTRERFVQEGSRAFGVSYVYSNLLGNESGRAIYDGGTLIASGGNMVARGPRFSYRDVVVTSSRVDVDATRIAQSRTTSFMPRIQVDDCSVVRIPFQWPARSPSSGLIEESAAWERGDSVKEEEFSRAIALALFDYQRKSRSNGFVVSLSGGADSAAVSALVWLMVKFAVGELGWLGLRQKLALTPELENTEHAVMSRLLTCVYQASENSSVTTREAAKSVAEAIGARFLEFDISSLVANYTHMVSSALGREVSWADDDIVLQNIQARVRAPGAWMVANLQNSLLLATSNRSEAAVGYATMDGDTCGGLSPVAGIDKAFLRQWLRWLEVKGPKDVGSLPVLININRQVPTAELRPLSSGQTDEDDLMPYPLLDAVERAAIRDKLGPIEVFDRMMVLFPEYGIERLLLWIQRFFQLWCRNQWKRERYAPSFHVDDENLDPKTWCRFPILSGGFNVELEQLRAHVAELPPS
jgi:NAD+ synthase (glutamine-hydrolysing)